MKEIKYVCDICRKKFDNNLEVGNEIQITLANGEYKVYNETCHTCTEKVEKIINEIKK